MSAATFLLILFSVLLSALAQVSFKYGVSAPRVRDALNHASAFDALCAFGTSPGILVGLALYGVGTVVWLTVLARTELSMAYPFVGLGFVLTAALGYFLFQDTFSLSRLCGTALVIAGIFLVARS